MFISVIIPLKINWLPVYRCSRQIKVGSRVRVEFAHKLYVGVVAECDVACELPEAQVLEVAEIADGLPEVSANELKLWQFVSEYYMCSIGEVYRAAYPKERVKDEEALCRRAARLAERQRVANEKLREKLNRKLERLLRRKEKAADNERLGYEVEAVLKQLAELSGAGGEADSGASVASDVRAEAGVSGAERFAGAAGTVQVIEGPCRTRTYRELIKEEFASASGQVLVLAPSIAECELLRRELAGAAILPCYNTETGIATRREIIAAARSGKSCVIVSTRAGIWLPFSNLRLIIVERENDPYYKVQEPAPRLNARDTAIMLGQIHHSAVVLGGDALSLETSLNLACGKYLPLRTASLKSDLTPESADGRSFAELLKNIDPRDLLDLQSSGPRIIDISQERRKKGMAGAISRIVLRTISRLSEVQKRHGAGGAESTTDPLQFILIRGWENEPELQATLERELPENLRKNVIIKSFAEVKRSPSLPSFCVIVVLQADALVSREDFRADEKAVQLVAELNARCCKLIVQTEIPERFGSTRSTADLLLERKSFNLPPYSRLIDIRISGLTPGVQSSALPNNGLAASGLASALPSNGVEASAQSSALPNNGVAPGGLATGLPSNGVEASGLATGLPSNGLTPSGLASALPSNGASTGAQSSALPNNGVSTSGLATALPNNGVSTGGLAAALPSNGVEARIDRLRNRLTSQFGRCDCLSPAPGTITLRITLPRDKQLTNNKLQLARILQDAERQFGRTLRIIPDVDPL